MSKRYTSTCFYIMGKHHKLVMIFISFFVSLFVSIKYSNKGGIRGTAVLNQQGNTMRLINCTFAENYSDSLGGIFNRGTMKVEGCVFINNTGIVRLFVTSLFVQRMLFHFADLLQLMTNIARYFSIGAGGCHCDLINLIHYLREQQF